MRSVPVHLACPEERDTPGLQQVHPRLISHLRPYPHNLLSPTSSAILVFFFPHCKSNHITLVLRNREQLLAQLRHKQKVPLDPHPRGSCGLCCITLQCPPPRVCHVTCLGPQNVVESAGPLGLPADLRRPYVLHLPFVCLSLSGEIYTCSSPVGSRRLRIMSKVSCPASGRSPSGSKDT